jgi:hypothetical protein
MQPISTLDTEVGWDVGMILYISNPKKWESMETPSDLDVKAMNYILHHVRNDLETKVPQLWKEIQRLVRTFVFYSETTNIDFINEIIGKKIEEIIDKREPERIELGDDEDDEEGESEEESEEEESKKKLHHHPIHLQKDHAGKQKSKIFYFHPKHL